MQNKMEVADNISQRGLSLMQIILCLEEYGGTLMIIEHKQVGCQPQLSITLTSKYAVMDYSILLFVHYCL